jgi:hypothetical protein
MASSFRIRRPLGLYRTVNADRTEFTAIRLPTSVHKELLLVGITLMPKLLRTLRDNIQR